MWRIQVNRPVVWDFMLTWLGAGLCVMFAGASFSSGALVCLPSCLWVSLKHLLNRTCILLFTPLYSLFPSCVLWCGEEREGKHYLGIESHSLSGSVFQGCGHHNVLFCFVSFSSSFSPFKCYWPCLVTSDLFHLCYPKIFFSLMLWSSRTSFFFFIIWMLHSHLYSLELLQRAITKRFFRECILLTKRFQ